MPTNLTIIGGGIVGLATAYAVSTRHPAWKIRLVEKESSIGRHQTGHNSGVLHSGIYYRPGSLKAETCRAGKAAMERFCREQGIDYRITGKLIVATDDSQRPRLRELYDRGVKNGVPCEIISKEQITTIEPHARGVEAIHVHDTGIVDYKQVAQRLQELLKSRGCDVRMGQRVVKIAGRGSESIVATASGEEWAANYVVNCAGLHSDRVARLSGARPPVKIIPFRGEYYKLVPAAADMCRALIYPVPDPEFPFLGVHCTKLISGETECGPNAVLAFAREGYTRTTINLRDLAETLSYPGFLRLARRYWSTGLREMTTSISKTAFTRSLQRLLPDVRKEHLAPAGAGVRAQAVSADGTMVDDFVVVREDHIVNVVSAPSPAATASLRIGAIICDRLDEIAH